MYDREKNRNQLQGSSVDRELNAIRERHREMVYDDEKRITHYFDSEFYSSIKNWLNKLTKASK